MSQLIGICFFVFLIISKIHFEPFYKNLRAVTIILILLELTFCMVAFLWLNEVVKNKSWFDQKFSFKDYETVTSFLTYYYKVPFYDLTLKVSGGKFLAKDVGVQIDLGRRFKNGSKVGAIVSLTDCDPQCVGEGSFNKWIYFNLPMDMFGQETRGRGAWAWSPLTKDAGQKVEPGSLYNLMTHAQDEVDTLRLKPWSIKKIFSGFSTSPRRE